MVQKSQHKTDPQATKLKQEDQEVDKEKMELAIAEYRLAKEDPEHSWGFPATDPLAQNLSKIWLSSWQW